MFIQNSGDILNIVKAVSILGISVFLVCFIYYLAMIMRELFKMIREMRERVNKIDEIIDAFKFKIEHSISYLSLIGDGVKKLVEMAREYGEEKENKKTKKSEKNKKTK